MRSLIIIAVLFVLANASYLDKLRFRQLINRYRNDRDQSFDYDNDDLNDDDDIDYNRRRGGGNLLGADDVDYRVGEYFDEIRRQRMTERDGQCDRRDQECYDDDEIDTDDRFDRLRDDQDDEYSGMGSTMKEVEQCNAKLTTGLYKQCKNEKDDKNTVVSPLSIQLALETLTRGARGNTKRELSRVISGRLQKHERRQLFNRLTRQLRKRDSEYGLRQGSTKIRPITGVFITSTTRAQQHFIRMVKQGLGATVQRCNFQRQPQQCRQMINEWMSTKTEQKINRIVPQDAITDNTKLILVNSLELKAKWGPQMRRRVTKEAKFYPLESRKVKIVEVLETQGRFKYYEDELVKIVGIPTQNHELTLYTIVPKDKDGLTDVEKLHLQDEVQLKKILKTADQRVRNVGVQLPKFEIKHKIDARRTLRKQGVEDAFDAKRADFSGICGTNEDNEYESIRRRNPFEIDDEITGKKCKLHLNKLIHQCSIKITEHGITATTGMQRQYEDMDERRRGLYNLNEMDTFDEITGFNRRDTTMGEKIVKANRAFAFVVKHNPTNQIVLVGRVIDAAQRKVNHVEQTINNVDQL